MALRQRRHRGCGCQCCRLLFFQDSEGMAGHLRLEILLAHDWLGLSLHMVGLWSVGLCPLLLALLSTVGVPASPAQPVYRSASIQKIFPSPAGAARCGKRQESGTRAKNWICPDCACAVCAAPMELGICFGLVDIDRSLLWSFKKATSATKSGLTFMTASTLWGEL